MSGGAFCGVGNNSFKAFCKRAKRSNPERARQSKVFFNIVFTHLLRQVPNGHNRSWVMGLVGTFYSGTLKKVYTTYDTHAYACDLEGPQVGLGMTEYHKPPVPHFLHWAFPLETHNYGSSGQLAVASDNVSFSIWSWPWCVSKIGRSCSRYLPHSLRVRFFHLYRDDDGQWSNWKWFWRNSLLFSQFSPTFSRMWSPWTRFVPYSIIVALWSEITYTYWPKSPGKMKRPHDLAWYHFARNGCMCRIIHPSRKGRSRWCCTKYLQGTSYTQDTSEHSCLEVEHDAVEPWLVGYIVTQFRRINPHKGSGLIAKLKILPHID